MHKKLSIWKGITINGMNIASTNINLLEKYKWKYDVVDNGKSYDLSLYCDDIV